MPVPLAPTLRHSWWKNSSTEIQADRGTQGGQEGPERWTLKGAGEEADQYCRDKPLSSSGPRAEE